MIKNVLQSTCLWWNGTITFPQFPFDRYESTKGGSKVAQRATELALGLLFLELALRWAVGAVPTGDVFIWVMHKVISTTWQNLLSCRDPSRRAGGTGNSLTSGLRAEIWRNWNPFSLHLKLSCKGWGWGTIRNDYTLLLSLNYTV